MTDDVLPFADDCYGFSEEEFYARYKMSPRQGQASSAPTVNFTPGGKPGRT